MFRNDPIATAARFLVPGLLWLPAAAQGAPAQSLAERLGYGADDILLISTSDDLGLSHAANAAFIDGHENGLLSTGSIMAPAPWFPEIARYAREHPEADLGIHLAHTCEWGKLRWGPVAGREQVPGLVDDEGFMHRAIWGVYANASFEEVLVEGRAQVELALRNGVDVTHLDSHMGTLQYSPVGFRAYKQLAVEYDLPIRMASRETLASFGFAQQRDELAAEGILSADHLVYGDPGSGDEVAGYWRRILRELRPGVNELYVHPALESEEMRHITGSWRTRAEEHRLFTTDEEVRAIVRERGIVLIGWRPIRDLQRAERAERDAAQSRESRNR